MLKELLGTQSNTGTVSTGIVEQNLLDGYYRVNVNGMIYTAYNQSASIIESGTAVSITNTAWGRFIVSASNKISSNIPKIIIRG